MDIDVIDKKVQELLAWKATVEPILAEILPKYKEYLEAKRREAEEHAQHKRDEAAAHAAAKHLEEVEREKLAKQAEADARVAYDQTRAEDRLKAQVEQAGQGMPVGMPNPAPTEPGQKPEEARELPPATNLKVEKPVEGDKVIDGTIHGTVHDAG
jgi:hypothetical protein